MESIFYLVDCVSNGWNLIMAELRQWQEFKSLLSAFSF